MTALRALLLGLLTWVSYVALRSLLQKHIPFTDWQSYVRQDMAITALRLLCAGSAFWIATRRWKGAALGLGAWRLGGAWAWASAGMLMVAFWLGSFAMPKGPDLLWIKGVELFIALVVAVNEEIGFRGLFYCASRELWGRRAAILACSLGFTAMHAGYQPWFHMAEIFLVGVALAFLRDRGASLPALVLVHFMMDAPYAIFLNNGPVQHWNLYYSGAALAALAVLAAWMQKEKPLPGSGALAFAYGSLKKGRWGWKELKLEQRADFMGGGSVEGRIFDLGEYPALVPGKGRVRGELWRLRDEEALKTLDAFEGEEYLRDEVEVEAEDGKSARAWAWVYAGTIKGQKELAGEW